MTFTFNIEIRFKVNAYSLLKSTGYVKYGPDRARKREYMLRIKIFNVALTLDIETLFKVTAKP